MLGKAPVKEDVGVFTVDMVVREARALRSARGPLSLRLDSSPISTFHDDWSLASSFTRPGQCIDMCRVDRKLSLDAESRSIGEMMRGESQTGLNLLGLARVRSRGSNMAGLL